MLSQEFPLPDVLRIWDSLLSDETRQDFLINVCTAMVILARNDILQNDFADNMKMLQVRFPDLGWLLYSETNFRAPFALQSYPPIDVQIILSRAAQISRGKK